jgi:alkaline phosphatase D
MTDDASMVFQHGVASGDPLPDRVVLWTRVTTDGAGDVPVAWVMARDAGLTDVVASGEAVATADADYTVHVDPDGLEPATDYWYAFRALEQDSPIARTRTLPVDTDHVRFAMVSCAKFNAGFFNVYSCIAARDDLDFMLHLGDYIYEMSNTPPASQTAGADIGRPFEPLTECVTLADYRTRYSQYHRDPDVQALHLRYAIIPTLDDHEFADGAWRDGSTEHKPEYGPWAERKADALRAREEWHAIRRPDPNDPSRVFRHIPLGHLADIFLTDTRSRRDEPVPEPAMSHPDRSAWGPEQRRWLLESIDESTATWRILGNPSVMSPIWRPDFPDDLKPALLKVKLIAEDGLGPDYDQWDGYPAERDAFFQHLIDHDIDNLVVLSGDVHISIATELHRDPFAQGDRPLAAEFVTPSLTSQNLDDKMGWPRHSAEARAYEARAVEYLPHWHWVDLDSHGYVIIDVTAPRVTAEWWHLDTVLERSTKEERAAAFAVEHGTARLEKLA